MLWGAPPDEALLRVADTLTTPATVQAQAEAMWDDARTRAQIVRFHEQWRRLGQIPHEASLADAMYRETRALIERVVFEEGRPWQGILRLEETYANESLAAHYGLDWSQARDVQDGWGWVPYQGARMGILSHGSFLKNGSVGIDTSPVQRGKILTTLLLCQPIPPPPPGVNTDDAVHVPDGACKEALYEVHSSGGCAGCHQYMDPVGMVLEHFSLDGSFRETETLNADCEISGRGALPSLDEAPQVDVQGVAGLVAAALESGRVEECAAEQLFRFTIGHNTRRPVSGLPPIHAEDRGFIRWLAEGFRSGQRLDALIFRLVGSDAFLYRRSYPEQTQGE